MSKKKVTLKQGCAIAVVIYFAVMAIFWFCSYEQLNSRDDSTDMLQNDTVIGEITRDTVFSQAFIAENDCQLTGLSFLTAIYGRKNTAHLEISVSDGNSIIAYSSVDTSLLSDNEEAVIRFDNPPELRKSKKYTVYITAPDGEPGNAVTIYAGTKYAAGKVNVKADLDEQMKTTCNGTVLDYALCWRVNTRTPLIWGAVYPFAAAGLGVLFILYCVYLNWCSRNGRVCLGLKLITAFSRYRYLIKQLVSRDFKTKYKRSVLGVLWSFLNPLLMMAVQYVVFSTLFSSSINNFALYLLIGIVCFNFFSECAGMCLTSIIGNASLITKVYVPKYIYPVSRAFSSCVNLFFSLIPLVGVMLITRSPLSKSLLLVPIPLLCLFAFSLGIGMILATMMVFFRDTQFLWGVISMVWMYITPIIYPESILPQDLMWLFRLNPLYHIVKTMRCMVMDGISPDPVEYLIMIGMTALTIIAGAFVFKKNQDKFVLNI